MTNPLYGLISHVCKYVCVCEYIYIYAQTLCLAIASNGNARVCVCELLVYEVRLVNQ